VVTRVKPRWLPRAPVPKPGFAHRDKRTDDDAKPFDGCEVHGHDFVDHVGEPITSCRDCGEKKEE
jgi:hypothetical protein